MILQLFKKTKRFSLERTYPAPIKTVWQAWTDAAMLRQWWGPENTSIPDCEIDLRVGGAISIVMEAGEGMGKYAGTRWPMAGTFTAIDAPERLAYEARSWTEGQEDETTILHTNEVTLRETTDGTFVRLDVAITDIGSKAKMAAFGMKFGYKAQFDKLEKLLADQ